MCLVRYLFASSVPACRHNAFFYSCLCFSCPSCSLSIGGFAPVLCHLRRFMVVIIPLAVLSILPHALQESANAHFLSWMSILLTHVAMAAHIYHYSFLVIVNTHIPSISIRLITFFTRTNPLSLLRVTKSLHAAAAGLVLFSLFNSFTLRLSTLGTQFSRLPVLRVLPLLTFGACEIVVFVWPKTSPIGSCEMFWNREFSKTRCITGY